MQSNQKCMKEILKYIDSNTGVEVDQVDNTISLKSIGFLTLINNVSKNGEFTLQEVVYNTLLCEKFGFIESSFKWDGAVLVSSMCNIFDTTVKGERFLNGEITL